MPPLFTVLLRGWLFLFPFDSAARRFSVGVSFITLTLACAFAFRRFRGSYFWIVLLIATSPLLMYYSQLVRGYTLLVLASMLCIMAWDRLIRLPSIRSATAYGITLVFGMFTHYYFGIIPFCLTLVCIVEVLWKRFQVQSVNASFAQSKRRIAFVLVASIAAAIACLPLLPFLRIDFQYQKNLREPRPLSVAAAVYTDLSIYSGYALGASQRELHSGLSTSQILESCFWFAILISCQAVLIRLSWHAWKGDPLTPYLIGLVAIPLPLLGIVGAISGITYNVRFVCWLVIPIALLTARAVEPHPAKKPIHGRCALLALLAVMAVTTFANYERVLNPRYQFEDSRSLAESIMANGSPQEHVHVVSDYLRSPVSYYLGESYQVSELPDPGQHSRVFESQEQARKSVALIQQSGDAAWIVYGRPFHGDPNGFFLEELEKKTKEYGRFVGLRLFRFEKN